MLGPHPEQAKREYRLVKLANGMVVLLVSVPLEGQSQSGADGSSKRASFVDAVAFADGSSAKESSGRPSLQEEETEELRAHLGHASRPSLRMSYSGSLRNASGSLRLKTARRSSSTWSGQSLMDQSRRAGAREGLRGGSGSKAPAD